jgi:hypothetical protein
VPSASLIKFMTNTFFLFDQLNQNLIADSSRKAICNLLQDLRYIL